MKNKMIILLGITVLTLGVVSGCTGQKDEIQNPTSDNTEMTSVQQSTSLGESVNQTTVFTGKIITEKKAMEIVLAKVKGASESDVRMHLDVDDGIQVYEGSIVYNNIEYDFELDANTGDILEWESDSVYDD